MRYGDKIETRCYMCARLHVATVRTKADKYDPPFLPKGWLQLQFSDSNICNRFEFCMKCRDKMIQIFNALRGLEQ